MSDTSERPDNHETLRDTSPFAHLWKEALAGEAIIERFFHGENSCDYSPIPIMRALLVQTWRPCGANGRGPAVGWALGTIFPEFDDLARPIKRRINHAAVAALPISFRPALLAGVSRVILNPDTLNTIRDETILRGEERSNAYARLPGYGLVLLVAPHKVVERLMAARELGLGSRGPDPKGPWTALDALGGEPRVALELGD